MKSLFKTFSIDRKVSRWEESIEIPSPVELHQGLWFKREDYFAPLGYGGINGAKVRQMLWLITKYIADKPKAKALGLIYAGSVKSPQLGRVSSVARHFGMGCSLVIASRLESAIRKNANVIIGANMGAQFITAKAPYNPVLQSTAKALAKSPGFEDYLYLEYGLSVDGTNERIETFYRFCSEQVATIPEHIETVIVPAGSCNTTLTLLYGIARLRPKKLKRVMLIGVGPNRVDWFEARLRLLASQSGIEVPELFKRVYPNDPGSAERYGSKPAPYELHYHDLFTTKFTSWDEALPASWGSIQMHPFYEAKVLTYIRSRSEFSTYLKDERSLFWIVGSDPSWGAMAPHLPRGDEL